jgi:DNA-binding IclR family transcriptional regulator
MTTDSGPSEPVSTGVDRALQIIMAVATSDEPNVGISQLSRQTGMSKAVVHRIVRTLVARDFFAYDEGSQRYYLGSGALVVGLAAVQRLNVPGAAAKHLEALVEATQETATLSVRTEHQRTYVRQHLSPREIHMSVRIGAQFPLHRGASSLAILAALDDAEIEEVIVEANAAAGGEAGIDSDRVRRQVAEIRERGYSYSRGERQLGAAALACAIRLSDGTVWGAASVCGPADRFDERAVEEYSKEIRKTSAGISRDLGFRGDIY